MLTAASECTVTLVHGTIPSLGPKRLFRQQRWIQEGSLFCLTMSASVNALFLPFSWSGKNSHKARLAAGQDLAASLRRTFADHPSRRHYVIAHSHGGNVALYALKELSEDERHFISGVVTMGTPFIHSSPRDTVYIRDNLMLCLSKGSVVWVVIFLIVILLGFGAYTPDRWVYLLSSLCGLAGPSMRHIARKYDIEYWNKAARKMDERLDAKLLPGTPLMCVVADRDEAKAWVRALDWSARIIFGDWLLGVIDALAALGDSITKFGFASDNYLLIKLMTRNLLVGAAGIVVSLLAYSAGVVFVMAVVIGNLLTVSSPWGYGQSILLPWVVRISVADTPNTDSKRDAWVRETSSLLSLSLTRPIDPCEVQLSKFAPRSLTFQHSWLHEDVAVIQHVAAWLKTGH
jgi:Protein of unknown function (DUF2974)